MFSLFKRNNTTGNNIFHCCQHKTASQWFNVLLQHRAVRQAAGARTTIRAADLWGRTNMPPLHNKEIDWSPPKPVPPRTIITCAFLTYPRFEDIPKPLPYRGFYVHRDPRDLLVSWYNSIRYTHEATGSIPRNRATIENLSYSEGLIHGAEILRKSNFAQALSWLACTDPNMKLCRYEDLFGDDQSEAFASLFEHLQLDISSKQQASLLEEFSFKNMTRGRKPGEVDKGSHLRRGKAGGWREELPDDVLERFYEITGTLTEDLGYSRD